jgi:cell division protein FtsB
LYALILAQIFDLRTDLAIDKINLNKENKLLKQENKELKDENAELKAKMDVLQNTTLTKSFKISS